MTDDGHGRQTPRAQCWDCGSEEFRILTDGGLVRVAECVECGGRRHPAKLYVPDENGRDHYNMEMKT